MISIFFLTVSISVIYGETCNYGVTTSETQYNKGIKREMITSKNISMEIYPGVCVTSSGQDLVTVLSEMWFCKKDAFGDPYLMKYEYTNTADCARDQSTNKVILATNYVFGSDPQAIAVLNPQEGIDVKWFLGKISCGKKHHCGIALNKLSYNKTQCAGPSSKYTLDVVPTSKCLNKSLGTTLCNEFNSSGLAIPSCKNQGAIKWSMGAVCKDTELFILSYNGCNDCSCAYTTQKFSVGSCKTNNLDNTSTTKIPQSCATNRYFGNLKGTYKSGDKITFPPLTDKKSVAFYSNVFALFFLVVLTLQFV